MKIRLFYILLLLLLSSLTFAQQNLSVLEQETVYPEWYWTEADTTAGGEENWTNALTYAFLDARDKGWKVVLRDSLYLVHSKIVTDLLTKNIEIVGMPGTVIRSTATLTTGVYFSFYAGHGINYPTAGAVYSNNGSQFTVINSTTLEAVASEMILTQRTSGTNNPTTTGTLTKISIPGGTGDTSYVYTETGDGQYYIPVGAFDFKNASNIQIKNVSFEFAVDLTPSLSYLNALLIKNCDNVFLENVSGKYAGYTGIRICGTANHYENFVSMLNCNALYNGYAGALLVAVKGGYAIGGNYSYNGSTPFVNGYGFSLSGQFGTDEDNENFIVEGITSNYNYRKGIDGHGCVNATVKNNFIKGYCASGIEFVNEGLNENYHFKSVRNIIIDGNVIENDSAWYAGLTVSAGYYSHPISFGSYEFQGGSYVYEDATPTSWIVCNNIIKNSNIYQGATNRLNQLITSFAGMPDKSIKIYGNILERATCREPAIYIGSGNSYGGQPKSSEVFNNTIMDVTTLQHIILVVAGEYVSIDHNKIINCTATGQAIRTFNYLSGNIIINSITHNGISGTFANGIYVSNGTMADVSHNAGVGTFTDSYLYVEPTIFQKRANNTYNSTNYPDDTTSTVYLTSSVAFIDDNADPNGLKFRSNIIMEHKTESDAGNININYNGFEDGNAYYRSANIWNGKQGLIASFSGTDTLTTFIGKVDFRKPLKYNTGVGTNRQVLQSDGSTGFVPNVPDTLDYMYLDDSLVVNGYIKLKTNVDNAALRYDGVGFRAIAQYIAGAVGTTAVINSSVLYDTVTAKTYIGSYGAWLEINPLNTLSKAGIVSAGTGNISKVWKTDGAGNPGWRVDSSGSAPAWGSITGTLSNQTDLQNALDDKQDSVTGAATTVVSSNLTTGRALVSDALGKIIVSSVTDAELGYMVGVTSGVQTQFNGKAGLSGTQTFTGQIDFRSGVGGIALNYNAGSGGLHWYGGTTADKFSVTDAGAGYFASYVDAVSGYKVNGTAISYTDVTGAASSTWGALTASGLYVAESSGGSPTRQLYYRTFNGKQVLTTEVP